MANYFGRRSVPCHEIKKSSPVENGELEENFRLLVKRVLRKTNSGPKVGAKQTTGNTILW